MAQEHGTFVAVVNETEYEILTADQVYFIGMASTSDEFWTGAHGFVQGYCAVSGQLPYGGEVRFMAVSVPTSGMVLRKETLLGSDLLGPMGKAELRKRFGLNFSNFEKQPIHFIDKNNKTHKFQDLY